MRFWRSSSPKRRWSNEQSNLPLGVDARVAERFRDEQEAKAKRSIADFEAHWHDLGHRGVERQVSAALQPAEPDADSARPVGPASSTSVLLELARPNVWRRADEGRLTCRRPGQPPRVEPDQIDQTSGTSASRALAQPLIRYQPGVPALSTSSSSKKTTSQAPLPPSVRTVLLRRQKSPQSSAW